MSRPLQCAGRQESHSSVVHAGLVMAGEYFIPFDAIILIEFYVVPLE